MATKEEHLKVLRDIYDKKIYLTPDDLAELLDCGKQTIYNQISKGTFKIPLKSNLMGDLIRVSIIDLAGYLAIEDSGEQHKPITTKTDGRAKLRERQIILFQSQLAQIYEVWNSKMEKKLLLSDMQ